MTEPLINPRSNSRHVEWLFGELPKLTSSGILPAPIAKALRDHYASQLETPSTLRLVPLVCALLGSLLIGCGIILLIAHNWDDLSRPVRAALSFAPVLLGIALTGFVLLRRFGSEAWREGAALFQTLTIGASIALVSQTYQISGNFPSFMLTWILLGLPVVYLLRSSSAAILSLIGATIRMGASTDLNSPGALTPNWLLLLCLAPHLFLLIRNRHKTSAAWLLWALVICLPILLGFESSQAKHHLWLVSFSGLFAAFYLFSAFPFFREGSLWLNPLRIGGAFGIGIFSLILTYKGVWNDLRPLQEMAWTPGSLVCLLFPIAAIGAGAFLLRDGTRFNPLAALFPVVIACGWLLSQQMLPAEVLMVTNGYVFLLAVSILIGGFRGDRLIDVNAGMVLLAALIIGRFFDSDLGFVVRGLTAIALGIGFLTVNYFFLKQRKARLS